MSALPPLLDGIGPGCRVVDAAAESLAQMFHETMERLGPDFGYDRDCAVPWKSVPSQNQLLMIAVAREILKKSAGSLMAQGLTAPSGGLKTALQVVMDHVDYTEHNCSPTQAVSAVLPVQVIRQARAALA